MDIPESRLHINWTSIIRRPGSAKTIDFKKDGAIMVKSIRPEWRNTKLIYTLRWEEDGGKIIEVNHSAFEQKRIKNNE
jgi:hypothetical protein